MLVVRVVVSGVDSVENTTMLRVGRVVVDSCVVVLTDAGKFTNEVEVPS